MRAIIFLLLFLLILFLQPFSADLCSVLTKLHGDILFWLLVSQVAERALYMWNNDHVDNLIRQSRKVILPIIFPALERNMRGHWNQVVKNLTLNVRKIFSDSDPELFGECLRKFEEEDAKEQEVRAKQEATWKQLEEMVTTKT